MHGKYLTLLLVSCLLLILSAGSGVCQSANVTVTVEYTPWNRIAYPEGVYEPYAEGLAGTHLFTFNITFQNLSASAGNVLRCRVRRSDMSRVTLEKTLSQALNRSVEMLSYTLKSSDPIDKHVPWQVENCSLSNEKGILYSTRSSYGSPLDRQIYVHGNRWTRFDTVEDDAYLASRCFLGIPKRYFNNTLYCDYPGDVGFSVAMSRGMYLEGYCHDGVDGPEENGDVDCNDIYCQGIPYSCATHRFAGDPFTGTCRNGLCWETKDFGGHRVTYYYTRYVRPGGYLKVRFDGGTYSTTKPVSFALTRLNGFSTYGGYAEPGAHKPPTETTTSTSYAVEDVNGYFGHIDFVMYVAPEGYSPGWNTFSVYMVHYGQDLLIDGIPFYVGDNAPSNWDESEDMPPIISTPCGDGLDNDLSYNADCRDINCDGRQSGNDCVGRNAYCEYMVEKTCSDCFDNDGDGMTDCADPNCNGKPGNPFDPSDACEFGCEGCGGNYPVNCNDGFNNDAEDGTDCYDRTQCWGRGGRSATDPCPAYENNDPSWCQDGVDNDYDGRKDCMDYDCRDVEYNGGNTCPNNEAYTAEGLLRPEQCFDGVDNDLDSPTQQYWGPGPNIDCADPDCNGMVNPNNPAQTCTAVEYDRDLGVNLCDNKIDDDADSFKGWPGGTDCTDADCWQKFDICGPCPAFENYHWDSCANGVDDDYDYANGPRLVDCTDQDCLGEFASVVGSGRCEAKEQSCGDSFDNDADGLTDCADPDCVDLEGPGGGLCAREESTAGLCTDNFDNDADGTIDCADRGCWGVPGSGCSAKFWGATQQFEVPYMTPFAYLNPTKVQYSHMERLHVNDSYVIRFRSSGSYEAVIITLGDATDSRFYFPYNASSCVLSGSPVLRWVSTQSAIGQIQHKPSYVGPGRPLRGFDVTLTCGRPDIIQNRTYPVTVTNLEGGSPEVGEALLTSYVYGIYNPTVDHLEVEPSVGYDVNVPYGAYMDVRAVPSAFVNGVSQCRFNMSGMMYLTSDDCILRYFGVVDDEQVPISAAVEDGSGNLGTFSDMWVYSLNTMPVERNFTLQNVFRKSGEDVSFRLSFLTAESGYFNGVCSMRLYNGVESQIGSYTVAGVLAGNEMRCDGTITPPSLQDGVYYIEGDASDEDGDKATSSRKFFFVCNDYASKGEGWDCSKADFDGDGIPDICVQNGSVTTTTSTTLPMNYTTTTFPFGKRCGDACGLYFNTEGWKCSADLNCYMRDSPWMWTYEGSGDGECYLVEPAESYCCCRLDGVLPPTTIPPSDVPLICTNGVQDEGEVRVDCGGVCPACGSCYNGIRDGREEGVDCSGECPECVIKDGVKVAPDLPALYIIGLPPYVTLGDNLSFTVVNPEGTGVQAYLEYLPPNKTVIKHLTDLNGRASFNATQVGMWYVDARKNGYFPAMAIWVTLPKMTRVQTIIISTSLLLPILLILWLIRRWRRQRKGTAATEQALKALAYADMLQGYAPVMVTEEAYQNMPDVRQHLKTMRLSDAELFKADLLSQRHDINQELARLLVMAEKSKLEKILTEEETELKEYKMTRIITIWDETKGKLTSSSQP